MTTDPLVLRLRRLERLLVDALAEVRLRLEAIEEVPVGLLIAEAEIRADGEATAVEMERAMVRLRKHPLKA